VEKGVLRGKRPELLQYRGGEIMVARSLRQLPGSGENQGGERVIPQLTGLSILLGGRPAWARGAPSQGETKPLRGQEGKSYKNTARGALTRKERQGDSPKRERGRGQPKEKGILVDRGYLQERPQDTRVGGGGKLREGAAFAGN